MILSLKIKQSCIMGAAALFLCAASLGAQSLSLEQSIELAQKNNQVVAAEKKRVEQAEQRLRQGKGGLLPDIRFRYLSLTRDNDDGTLLGSGSNSFLAAHQPLFEGFRGIGLVAVYESELQRERLALANTVRVLKQNVARTFFSAVTLKADLDNIQKNIVLLDDRLVELRSRVRLGKSRGGEVLMTESNALALTAQREAARSGYGNALETLSSLVGEPVDGVAAVAFEENPPVPAIDADQLFLRSDVQVYRADIEAQKYRLSRTRGQRLPALDLDASWYLSRSGAYAGGDWDLLFSLNFPIFQGGSLVAQVKEQDALLAELTESYGLKKRDVLVEARNLLRTYRSSIDQADALRKAFAKAQQSYESQLKDYRLGLVNNLDVLQSMATLLSTRQSMDRAIIQTELNKVLLETTLHD